jgi:hypothetical protein
MGQFRSLGGVFTSPPEVVPWGALDRFLFVFGVRTDQALWYAQLDGFTGEGEGGTWSAWQSLGGVVMSPPRAVRSGESSVDVFAVGAHSELLHWQFRNNVWTMWPLDPPQNEEVALARPFVNEGLYRNWESLGGMLVSPPHAVMFGELNDTISVFATGTDHALWVRSSVNGSWLDWVTLGHTLSSSPHAVTWRRETFAVFALGTDSAIWYTMGSDWQSLGGPFSSAPYAVSTFNHIHVFAADTQSALKHCTWDGSSWSDWESLGGILMSPPTANNFQNNDLVHVFGLGTDSAIWRRRWLGDSWTDWHSLGGPFISPPATITRLPNPVSPMRDLAALRADHAIWHTEEDDP